MGQIVPPAGQKMGQSLGPGREVFQFVTLLAIRSTLQHHCCEPPVFRLGWRAEHKACIRNATLLYSLIHQDLQTAAIIFQLEHVPQRRLQR